MTRGAGERENIVSTSTSYAYGTSVDVERVGALDDARDRAQSDGVTLRGRRHERGLRRIAGVSAIVMFILAMCASVMALGALRAPREVQRPARAALGAATLPANFFGKRLDPDARARLASKASQRNNISLRTRVPTLRGVETSAEARLTRGVPGLSQHVLRVQKTGDDARVLVLTKPQEWGMTFLLVASVKRWAPALLPHITILTYDEKTQKACELHRGVDCFYDRDFVRHYSDPNASSARNAMSWRKVHAALELLRARIPVVILDADTVFLNDPTEVWTKALSAHDCVVTADVGNEFESQGNANTKLVIFPAHARSIDLVHKWLDGERAEMSGVNFGEYPEQSYWNYVVVPESASTHTIHAMSTTEASNFITANAGADGVFDGTYMVTASYCGETADKERFLQHVLETKHHGEAALGIGPSSSTTRDTGGLPLSSATDFDHDGVADASAFPNQELRCDHVKRRLVEQRRYQVTSDRHIVWT